MCSNYPGIKLEPALENKKTKINICHHMLTSSTQLQNRSFHVVERTRTSSKCQKMKNARAKCAKIHFFTHIFNTYFFTHIFHTYLTIFIVKYANLWGFCHRSRRACLRSLITSQLGSEMGKRHLNKSKKVEVIVELQGYIDKVKAILHVITIIMILILIKKKTVS